MSKPSFLRRLLGGIWSLVTWIRLALANLLFIAMLAIIYFVYFGGSPEPLPESAALRLDLVGSVVDEKRPVEPVQALFGEASPMDREILLRDVIEAIEIARDDPAINSMVLELDYLVSVGISRSLEIAAAIESFRATGKPVVAVADFYTQDQYLLAVQADTVVGHPMGGVALEGLGAYYNYYADALDKLSVSMHVFRAGRHKSAVEPLLRNDMSPEEKEVTRDWLADIWGFYTQTVERRRELPEGSLDAYINGFAGRMASGSGDAAQDALDAGLLDQLLDRSATGTLLEELVGATDDEGYYQGIPFEYYLKRKRGTDFGTTGDAVAVITAQGDMLPGEQPPGTIGGDSLAHLINSAMHDDNTRAIVLRVNTGGGSMFAAEVIREQLLAAKAEGLPVVVSMGAVAASGGYYIAAEADQIWALPTTITGSIGVFAAFPTLENLFGRMGIHTDGVGTTELAGSLRLDRPLAPALEAALQAGVEHAYRSFLGVVAGGRKMSLEQAGEVAEGRVWSATDAHANGLVDHLGGLDEAIAAAATLAGLEDYEVDYWQLPQSPAELFWQQLAEQVSVPTLLGQGPASAGLRALAGPLLDAAAEIGSLQDPRNLYYRCMSCGIVD